MSPPWSRPGPRFRFVVAAVALAAPLILAGCAGSGAGGSAGPSSASASDAAPPSAAPATPVGASATVAGLDAPPDALLAAEGGDPVTGQLGTYTWVNSGSDSPWLPGAPIAVGVGEPLAVTFAPETAVESWTAIYVPASADGPAGAQTLGQGSGPLTFAAPGPGSWTMALDVTFAQGTGTAYYAWRLDVD